MSWKYREVYMPNHPQARSNGCILEHRHVAEKKLGRLLKNEEVVHHIDEDRTNNSDENLVVFATQDDHARFHATGIMIEIEHNLFISPEVIKQCDYCGNDFKSLANHSKYCNKECQNKGARKTERPSKEELDCLIHTYPFTKIATMYNVSDNAIRKWCKNYGLPYKKKDIDKRV